MTGLAPARTTPISTATIIFAGGGSGGHIYPGLAIAEQVRVLADQRKTAQPRIVFVCSERELDSRILTDAGVTFVTSPARPALASIKGMARFALAWRSAVAANRRLLRDAGTLGPVHVCAMGGFVAAPCVRAALVERTKSGSALGVTMVNLDAVPGKANRWIAPRCDRVFTALPVAEHFMRSGSWQVVPPIVRARASVTRSPRECRIALGLDPDRPVLMVTGGSQGLRSLNEFVVAFAESPEVLRALRDGAWQVLHQTGRGFDEAIARRYAKLGIDAIVVAFSDRMSEWWGAAELCVATAGAGTIAEVWCNRVPGLLLPYPHHRDQHQKLNARLLVEAGGGSGGVRLGEDLIDAGRNLERNGATLVELLARPDLREGMRKALGSLGPADGAAQIAQALLDEISLGAPRTA